MANINHAVKNICISLMHAENEKDVINILKDAGYWDNPDAWRYYGDRPINYKLIGNQQGWPDAAIVEKLINSVDARLLNECLEHDIDPEGASAPKTMREAVAKFYDNDSPSSAAGLLSTWPNSKRTQIAKGITLAATGNLPEQGDPCFVISDCGEGQTPDGLPLTILSLDQENKVKVPFVQGKFNMGGTGVLEFCGERNLQLVLSRRNPKLTKSNSNTRDNQWGFTIVRRENPIGGKAMSVYTYLAPLNTDNNPRKGNVLSFSSEFMQIFPEGKNPFGRESAWGTLIKLYEYSTSGFSRSNIILRRGLMRQLDLLLPDLALPIRLYECRDYKGHKGSFETNLTGIGVRLEDDKSNNLEAKQSSIPMSVQGQRMTATLYIFKKGKAIIYRSNEGIIFTVNGQTHGYLSKNFFKRNRVKSHVGHLANSILIVVDCSEIEGRAREQLFMPSRDRLREGYFKSSIENELEEILRNHRGIRELREQRRREELQSILEDSKPLGDILAELIKDSPTLSTLFLQGGRLSNPFKTIKTKSSKKDIFSGKRFPTYFKFNDQEYGDILNRNCHINKRARITFETNATNDYFSRKIQPGNFVLFFKDNNKELPVLGYSLNLENGIATLNLQLPERSKVGDNLEFKAVTSDDSRVEPFVNTFCLNILKASQSSSTTPKRRKPPGTGQGKDRETPSGLSLPNIIEVYQNSEPIQKGWDDMDPPFTRESALRIISSGYIDHEGNIDNKNDKEIYDFFVNVDNLYLKTEQKISKISPELLRAKFVYGIVLVGLSIINHNKQFSKRFQKTDSEIRDILEKIPLEERVEIFTEAISPVLVPMINELGGLELGDD